MSMDGNIKVLIVDDHPLVREGLAGLLHKSGGIQVVGQAGSCAEGLGQAKTTSPDVVLLDVSLPDESGLALARKLKAEGARPVKILFLSMHEEEEFVLQAFRAGGDGYVIKSSRPDEVVEGIRSVAQGKRYVSAAIGRAFLEEMLDTDAPGTPTSLEVTEREREVLQLVARGMSAKEVANTLDIGHRTVETHRANLMRKLGAKNSAELVRIAIASGLVKN